MGESSCREHLRRAGTPQDATAGAPDEAGSGVQHLLCTPQAACLRLKNRPGYYASFRVRTLIRHAVY
ncbi:MAG TPA: hypothetical protein VGY31_17130 [Terriglobia bacterium]|nr:hypothetical protein [Terriglobia bacterium]